MEEGIEISTEPLLAEASRLRGGTDCRLREGEIYEGGSNVVYVVEFDDGVKWAARMLRNPFGWQLTRRAISVLQYMKGQSTILKVPTIYGYSLESAQNPIGCAYVFLEWLEGTPLKVWNTAISREKRQRLLDELADFLLTLWSLEIPSNNLIGAPLQSYFAYLQDSVDRGLRRTIQKTANWGDPIDYLIQRSMINRYVNSVQDITGFAIAHGDLNAYNIIADDNGHLKGVIDWDFVHNAPLQPAVRHPWFIADIPRWNNDGVEKGMTFEDDRAYLVHAIREEERRRGLNPTISKLLRDSWERHFFEASLHNKAIHAQFTAMHCARTESNLKAGKAELERFVLTHPEFEEVAALAELRTALA